VGNLGNSTGCHLHFEVHPKGGSIYADDTDPAAWLAANIGRSDEEEGTGSLPVAPARPVSNVPGLGFTIATFNVLGSTHTAPGGNKPAWREGPDRMRGAVTMLDRRRVDVVGFQEFQGNQLDAFRRLAGDRYAVWHPAGDTENAIGWRKADWTWVSGTSIKIPYFEGQPRRMPVVTLRFRHGDGEVMTFANFHNPADTGQHPHQGHWRAIATDREAALVQRLNAAGRRVFVTGDMNVHQYGLPGMVKPDPSWDGIDWILGTRGTRFIDQTVDKSGGISDHNLVAARVLVGDR
jgi:hypothetical protein